MPTKISTANFLARGSNLREFNGAEALKTLETYKSGNVFQASKSECTDDYRCISVYLMQQLTHTTHTDIQSYNGTRNYRYLLSKTPLLHAIIEPYDYSFRSESYESFAICRRYGPPVLQLMICGMDLFDSVRNETFLVLGK